MNLDSELTDLLVRKGIAQADERIDLLVQGLRDLPNEIDVPVTREIRISALIKAITARSGPMEGLVLLAVALDRILSLEDFDKDVPRDDPESK